MVVALLVATPAWADEAWGKLSTLDGKTTWPLDKTAMVVGTGEADVVVQDATVSPQQARLAYKDGIVTIEDLGSKFGTLLDGTQVKKGKPMRILQPAQLSLGALQLKFEFGVRPKLLPPTQPPAKSGKAKPKAPAGKGK
jgi:predicted component of type VI protein secretion system